MTGSGAELSIWFGLLQRRHIPQTIYGTLSSSLFLLFSFTIKRALVGYTYGGTWWQKRSPEVKLSTGSSKPLEPPTQKGFCAAWKHWRCEGKPSFSSISHLLFAFLSLNTKPAHSLVKEGQHLAHWSLSTGTVSTWATTARCPCPTRFQKKRLDKGSGDTMISLFLSAASMTESLSFPPKTKRTSQGCAAHTST